MRVALINPYGVELFRAGNILNELCRNYRELVEFTGDELEVMPSLGLLMMAALLPPQAKISYIEDFFYCRPENSEPPAYFKQDFDLVLLSGYTLQAPRAYEIADHFLKKGSCVILGGQHASSLPEEAKQHCTTVIVGEAEEVFPLALADLLNGKLKPFYYSGKKTAARLIPSPRFELLSQPERYNKVPVQATRGCPYSCEFCSIKAVYGNRYRKRPVEKVIADIKLAKTIFPHPHISFTDENMLVDKKYAKELVGKLIPLNLSWEAYSDITVAEDEELLKLLKASNCLELEIGLETVNEESLKAASPWKAAKIKDYPAYIKKIQDCGIGVMGLFVIGFDQDRPDIFAKIWEFIKENQIFEADLAILNPLPGSPLYLRLKAEDRILSYDWGGYTWNQINFKPKLMSVDELKNGMLWLYGKTHSPEWKALKNSPLNPRLKTSPKTAKV